MHWLKHLIQPRKCPECGGRLRKVIASDESFSAKRGNVTSGGPTGFVHRVMFIPVYLKCERCKYRLRMRNIRVRI